MLDAALLGAISVVFFAVTLRTCSPKSGASTRWRVSHNRGKRECAPKARPDSQAISRSRWDVRLTTRADLVLYPGLRCGSR